VQAPTTTEPKRHTHLSEYAWTCLEALARIAQHRPLAGIDDSAQRAAAERVRVWFSSEFVDALVD
jgi:hypothetical protein